MTFSPAETETGDVTGTADKDYNIIWFTETCLKNVLRLENYIKDAERREQRRLNAGVIQEAHTVTLSPWLIRTRYFITSFILNEQVDRTLCWFRYGRTC